VQLLMRDLFSIILFFLFIPQLVFSQEFGCFGLDSESNYRLGIYERCRIENQIINNMDWSEFSIDSNVADGHCKKLEFSDYTCFHFTKMEGFIVNGLQEGTWKFYLNESIFYIGSFKNGKKEGLWKGYYLNENSDSICISKIEFRNNLFDGISKYFDYNGKLYKSINHENGLKNGQEIEYFQNDTKGCNNISKLIEYKHGVLDGKYLIYSRNTSFDTLTYGIYSNGEKNGQFIFYNFSGSKYVIDFIKDKVDGKLKKYFSNGTLAYELDYKNNLPFNLIQINDTNGNQIESNTLNQGTGILNFYYDNGLLFSSCEYKNQLIFGKIYHYYKSGKIMEEGNLYTNNQKVFKKITPIHQLENLNIYSSRQLNFTTGTNYSEYNEDGTKLAQIFSTFNDSLSDEVIVVEHYANEKVLSRETEWRGLKYGQEIVFYKNGHTKEIGYYIIIDHDSIKTSEKNGIFKYYHSNGSLKAEVTFLNGKEVGNSYYYDDSGILKRMKVIETNGGIYNIFDKDTVNRIDKNGAKQGKWINIPYSFYEERCFYRPSEIKYYKDDKPIGIWEYYSEDGKKLLEMIIWQDTLNAYCKRFNYQRKLIAEGHLINHTKNGEWKEYHSTKGYLLYKGNYDCGKRNGIWQVYKRNGKLKETIEYVDGMVNIF